MNKIEITKLAVRVIAGAGTTTIVKNIIQNNVRVNTPLEAIPVAVASLAIGSMASTAVKSHTDSQIDTIVEAWQKATSSTNSNATPA